MTPDDYERLRMAKAERMMVQIPRRIAPTEEELRWHRMSDGERLFEEIFGRPSTARPVIAVGTRQPFRSAEEAGAAKGCSGISILRSIRDGRIEAATQWIVLTEDLLRWLIKHPREVVTARILRRLGINVPPARVPIRGREMKPVKIIGGPAYISIGHAARDLGVSSTEIYRSVYHGKLVRGRRFVFTRAKTAIKEKELCR